MQISRNVGNKQTIGRNKIKGITRWKFPPAAVWTRAMYDMVVCGNDGRMK